MATLNYAAVVSVGFLLFLASSCKTTHQPTAAAKGYALDDVSVLWPNATASVCWADWPEDTKDYRDFVQKAVTSQFNARTVFKFTGWGSCSAESKGLHIHKSESGISSSTIGMDESGNAHMSLTYPCDTDSAKNLSCSRNTALHEFAHAAGLLHEHERPDATHCDQHRSTGHDAHNVVIGAYDPESITNYCRTDEGHRQNIDLSLSAGDIESIRAYYSGEVISPAKDRGLQCVADQGVWRRDRLCCQDSAKATPGRRYMHCYDDPQLQCQAYKGSWVAAAACCLKGVPPADASLSLVYEDCKTVASRYECVSDHGNWTETGRCCSVSPTQGKNYVKCYSDPALQCKDYGGTWNLSQKCCSGETPPKLLYGGEKYIRCDLAMPSQQACELTYKGKWQTEEHCCAFSEYNTDPRSLIFTNAQGQHQELKQCPPSKPVSA